MDKLFYKDVITKLEVSYDELLLELAGETYYNPYCKTNSYYEIFKQIIFSLLIGEEIILLDSDFSNDELKSLLGNNFTLLENYKQIEPLGKIDFSDLPKMIDKNIKDWKITLFTSGTTGQPKKISHTFESISRFVKTDNKRKENVWGFAYNPTHMAGIQVFFQALLNQNTIIRLFGVDRDSVFDLINSFKITNISATPTFYRLLLPNDYICTSVKNITSGGEKFDANTLQLLNKVFPNSRIRNVYASTEAGTLFASDGDVFTLKSDMHHLIKIENNELFLHKSLIGKTDENIQLVNDWYATGDLVNILTNNPLSFKFISRKSEIINTGGYKVDPSEVEELIRLCKGVKDVFVFGKKSSILGNIVCCEVISNDVELTEKKIREFLQQKLQEYKIPRVVKFVDHLTTTRTGKLSRK